MKNCIPFFEKEVVVAFDVVDGRKLSKQFVDSIALRLPKSEKVMRKVLIKITQKL